MCPLLDASNPRCSTHLTLRNLAGAFTHCADRYTDCHIYRELLARAIADERPTARQPMLAAS